MEAVLIILALVPMGVIIYRAVRAYMARPHDDESEPVSVSVGDTTYKFRLQQKATPETLRELRTAIDKLAKEQQLAKGEKSS